MFSGDTMTSLELEKLGISGHAIFSKMIQWGWIAPSGESIPHTKWLCGNGYFGQGHSGKPNEVAAKRSFARVGR